MDLRKSTAIPAFIAMLALCSSGIVNADDSKAVDIKVEKKNTIQKKADKGQLDHQTTGNNVRGSKFVGINIVNPKGENVGEIYDLVLDSHSRSINYAVVSYGGILGIGDKLFAVPYGAFHVKPDPENKDEHIVTLDVTQEQLEGAKGFDEENWPDFANKDFLRELDDRYAPNRKDVKPDSKNVESDRQLGLLDSKTPSANIRYSHLTGMDIYNNTDEVIGEVNDVVIDCHNGEVRYTAVEFEDGIVADNDKLYAIPFKALRVDRRSQDADEKDEYILVLNIDQDQLKDAEGFDEDHWPDFSERNFTMKSDRLLNVDVNKKGVKVDVNVNK